VTGFLLASALKSSQCEVQCPEGLKSFTFNEHSPQQDIFAVGVSSALNFAHGFQDLSPGKSQNCQWLGGSVKSQSLPSCGGVGVIDLFLLPSVFRSDERVKRE
jgi:hypothetical protein